MTLFKGVSPPHRPYLEVCSRKSVLMPMHFLQTVQVHVDSFSGVWEMEMHVLWKYKGYKKYKHLG